MDLNATWPLDKTLAQAKEKKLAVGVHLRSGTTLTGQVKDVAEHFLVLGALQGKEFYDAVVRLEDVSAVEVRVRTK